MSEAPDPGPAGEMEPAVRPTGPPGPRARLVRVTGRGGRPVLMLGASPVLSISWELFIMAVTLVSVVNLVLYLPPILPSGVRVIVFVVDVLLTIPLFADFALRYRVAPDRSAYLLAGRGWLDLVGSLPFPLLRVLRLVRVRRIGQHLGQRGLRGAVKALLLEPAAGAFLGVILLTILVLEIGSAVMLVIEAPAAGALITTPSDALWFSYETITTVGYGDVYPITNMGRLVGVVVLTLGIALFGTFTGYLANAFLSRSRSSPDGGEGIQADEDALDGSIPSADASRPASSRDPGDDRAPATRADLDTLRSEVAELRKVVARLADREPPP